MNQAEHKTSSITKVALGVALPMVAFIIYDLCLFSSGSGKGEDTGFAGMGLVFGSAIVIPALLIVNSLIMIPQWKNKIVIILMGFIFPVITAIAQFKYLYGR